MSTTDPAALRGILDRYGVPDPSLVSKLNKRYKDKNGNWRDMYLDYVGHAEITRILIEVDPDWNWEPVAWTENGRPAASIVNGNAVMWARLTVLGKTILGVGTAPSEKADLDKELIGDFLRNAAMRFGIALSLWSKAEWDEQQTAPAAAAEPTRPADMGNDPYSWAITAFGNATTIDDLDAAARIARHFLSEADRDALRPMYLEAKTALEAKS